MDNYSSDAVPIVIYPNYFFCDSGEIISMLGRCNYNSDCLDDSDERDCEERTGKLLYIQ